MKEIELTQGKVALVDDEDYEYLSQWNWFAAKQSRAYYAKRTINRPHPDVKRMHRVILEHHDVNLDGLEVDHINGDGLDNRKENLRVATHLENSRNRRKHQCKTNTHHPYKGITTRDGKRWISRIRVGDVRVCLGRFSTPEDAAKAYDEAAEKYFGEFARPNNQYVEATPLSDKCSPSTARYVLKHTNKKHKDARSVYRGVSPTRGRWRAEIYINGKNVYCGSYRNQEDAAMAYNEAALKYFGKEAKLNKICGVQGKIPEQTA